MTTCTYTFVKINNLTGMLLKPTFKKPDQFLIIFVLQHYTSLVNLVPYAVGHSHTTSAALHNGEL